MPVLRGVTITDIGSEGNAIARVDDMVLFVPGMIPGDVIDVRVTKKKKRYMEGVALEVITPSPDRTKPPCRHFGVCGGCRWQHLPYDKQLFYKAQQVRDNLTRIGHTPIPEIDPIVGSEKIYGYRNKLEFTFSQRRWMTGEELETWIASKEAHQKAASAKISSRESHQEAAAVKLAFMETPQAGEGESVAAPSYSPALGFHIPGIFDKVLDINECLLMSEPADAIRNEVRRYALERKLAFYDFREHRGFLRTMFVRLTTASEVMVVLVTTDTRAADRDRLLEHLAGRFPEITSLWYVINTKKNDSIADLTPVHFRGSEFITETIEGYGSGSDRNRSTRQTASRQRSSTA